MIISANTPAPSSFFNRLWPSSPRSERPNPYGGVWSNLRAAHTKLNQPTPAIFFGKQAVNVIQGMRAHSVKLEKDLQKSFLKDKEYVYRDLADRLIEQSRLSEAEQVLAMLKEEEYFDFIRRDSQDDVRATQGAVDPDDPNPTAKPGSTTTRYTHPYYWAPFIMMGNWL